MATRGTYNFTNNYLAGSDVCIYVHHDNYPSGAAQKLASSRTNGGRFSVESFIRNNDGAQITKGHDAHGDTEYYYDIDTKKRMVECWKVSNEYDDEGGYRRLERRLCKKPIEQFIQDYVTGENDYA